MPAYAGMTCLFRATQIWSRLPIGTHIERGKTMRRSGICGRAGIAVTAAVCGLAAIAVIGAVALAPRPAAATPQYAQQTGLPCRQCHVSPAGGSGLKPFGQRFKANLRNVR